VSSEIDVPPEIAAEMLARGAQVIDVREPYEREAGYIAGTRHVELGLLAAQAATIDRDRPVVFQCRLGGRSAMAAEAFRADGYDAYNLTGGLMAWVASGLPIEPADGYVADH
jgi:rhodanese-related sulfurtransferase